MPIFKDVMLEVTVKPTFSFRLGGWTDTFSEVDGWRDFSALINGAGQLLIVRWEDCRKARCEVMSATPSLIDAFAPHIPVIPDNV